MDDVNEEWLTAPQLVKPDDQLELTEQVTQGYTYINCMRQQSNYEGSSTPPHFLVVAYFTTATTGTLINGIWCILQASLDSRSITVWQRPICFSIIIGHWIHILVHLASHKLNTMALL